MTCLLATLVGLLPIDAPSRPFDKTLEAAAGDFVRRGLAEARRQGLVPRRILGRYQEHRGGPWPPYWPCWDIGRSAIAEPFATALREAYPARFGDASSKLPWKEPSTYITAFLRAVICDSVLRFEQTGTRSWRWRQLLPELDRVVSAEGQAYASLWVVADLDFSAVSGERIGEITLLGVAGADGFDRRRKQELLVSRLMPEALWVAEFGHPTSTGTGHQGLLFASGIGQGDHWAVTRGFDSTIGRLVTVLQLATATTGRAQMLWAGEPSIIHKDQPEANAQPGWFPESHWRRVGTLTPDQVPGLRDLAALVARLDVGREHARGSLPSVAVAMGRYARSFRFEDWRDSVLDLATSLEASIGQGVKEEIGLTLRTRAAHLLAHDDSQQADEVYRDVEDLYTLRSDIIHGSTSFRKGKDVASLCKTRGYTQVLEFDRLQVLLDRWRDIARRAIAGRLILGDDGLGTPLWPLTGEPTKVDRALIRRDCRDAWRERIVEGARKYRLPLLADPAPPLIDYLHYK